MYAPNEIRLNHSSPGKRGNNRCVVRGGAEAATPSRPLYRPVRHIARHWNCSLPAVLFDGQFVAEFAYTKVLGRAGIVVGVTWNGLERVAQQRQTPDQQKACSSLHSGPIFGESICDVSNGSTKHKATCANRGD